MPTVQNLKKKLRGIRTTQKVSKAMKTASTVKYSRINTMYAGYAVYEEQCSRLYEIYGADFNMQFLPTDMNAPQCLVVMASNKGMCGGFNSDVLSFAEEIIDSAKKPYTVIICGKQAEIFFDERKIPYEKNFVFDDIPVYKGAVQLFEYIYSGLRNGRISGVKIVYPQFVNMMNQAPVCCELFNFNSGNPDIKDNSLFVPDRQTVIVNAAEKIMASLIYKKILETALGAQAATLMAMRTAYDTATDYCAELEGEINRKRQSQVTADIIETSADHSQDEEEIKNV